MKKFTLLCLAGFLFLAFGATTNAQAPKLEWSATGYFEFQTFLTENAPGYAGNHTNDHIYAIAPTNYNTFTAAGQPDKGLDRTEGYLEQRTRLWVTAAMGKGLSSTMYFEIDAPPWGGASGAIGKWNTDQTAVEVAGLWLDVDIPSFGIPFPMTTRIGVQPLAIRPAFLVYTDGAGITGSIKIDPAKIDLYYFKAIESHYYTYASNDVDVYGIGLSGKIDTFTIGGYYLYYNMNAYPMAFTGTTPTGTQSSDMWWLGLYADGKAGPVNLNFDFGYDSGKVRSELTPSVSDVKYSGWATRLKIDYPWEKFNFGVVGMYASGADANETSPTGMADGTSTKVKSWVVPPGSEQAPVMGTEAVVAYGMWAGASGGAGLLESGNYTGYLTRGGLGGTWFAKLYASAQATPWYKVTLQGLYIGDTTKNGNTYGTARMPNGITLRDDKDIGWELDLINELQVYKNLKFSVAGGVLFAGDAMDLWNSATSSNFSMKNPWAIRTQLMYTF